MKRQLHEMINSTTPMSSITAEEFFIIIEKIVMNNE